MTTASTLNDSHFTRLSKSKRLPLSKLLNFIATSEFEQLIIFDLKLRSICFVYRFWSINLIANPSSGILFSFWISDPSRCIILWRVYVFSLYRYIPGLLNKRWYDRFYESREENGILNRNKRIQQKYNFCSRYRFEKKKEKNLYYIYFLSSLVKIV